MALNKDGRKSLLTINDTPYEQSKIAVALAVAGCDTLALCSYHRGIKHLMHALSRDLSLSDHVTSRDKLYSSRLWPLLNPEPKFMIWNITFMCRSGSFSNNNAQKVIENRNLSFRLHDNDRITAAHAERFIIRGAWVVMNAGRQNSIVVAMIARCLPTATPLGSYHDH